jgi:hypothetical protein
MSLRRLVLSALLVAPCFTGCAGPRTGPIHDVSQQGVALLAGAPGVYGPDAAKIAASPADARVRATFEGAIPAAARASRRHEPALDLVARVIADLTSAEQQPPSQALVEWLFWRAGAVSRVARVETMVAQGVDDLDLQTTDYAGRLQASVYPESFGVARSSRGRPTQVIVIGRHPLDVEAISKTYAPGAPIALKVRPLDAFTELSLAADDENGGVTTERLAAGDGGAFTVTRKAPGKPGRYFLEITGLDPRTLSQMPENPWRRTLFWVPIYVGVPEAVAPDDFIRAPAPSPADPVAWGAKIAEGYNEARAKAGKKPLALDGRLTTLAGERSALVARAGREPPPDVVLADKLAASGFPPHDYDEHQAVIDSVSDYVHLRLLVPSVRRRLMSAEALVVGLGLTPRAPNARGEAEVVLIEDTVDPVARLDPARDRPRVLAALDALAVAEGRAAFKHDDDVAKVLQGFVEEVCAGQKRPNQMKPLVDKARGVGEKFHSWGTPVWRAGYDYTRWQETSLLAKAKEAPLPYAEAAICQGDLPGKPGGAYAVVIQYGP